MKTTWFRTGAALAAFSCAAVAQVPTVSISAAGFPVKTAEPCPVCLVAPIRLTLTRTGTVSHPLNVHLQIGGTATSGVDYIALPTPMTIPAGHASVSFNVFPLDDHLAEGPEVVAISVRGDTALYNAGVPSRVLGVIGDDEAGAPSERLDVMPPENGAAFPAGVSSIRLRALGVSVTREIDQPVEFLADGVVIGQSSPLQFGRPPIPCLPREDHEFVWPHPANGHYVITARTPAYAGPWLESAPIHITVGNANTRPVISLITTARVAEEDSSPTMRPMRLRGEFTISRTGSTVNAQPMYLYVSGTATPGTDYHALPIMVTIPAGAASVAVPVDAIPDHRTEPLETVIAEVSNCPPGDILPPCYDFDINPVQARDTVLIRDDGVTTASLEITAPQRGENFAATQGVNINATALDVHGGITRVDFYAGDTKIGTSELLFFAPPQPAQPIYHSFFWDPAPLGRHVLTARAISVSGVPVISLPVTITVGGNRLPAVQVTAPADGAQIPSGHPVNITVQATDPDGYTDTAEFYANGHKLGEVTLNFLVPPPPGENQTFTWLWTDAPPGTHILSARARDDTGAWGTSPPVTVVVTAPDALPVITVHPLDPFAVEPAGGLPANTASFRFRRHGSTAGTLSVNYTMHGTATNGMDYVSLNGFATFAAGTSITFVILTPLADNLTEHREKVILQLEPQFDDGPERYRVGLRRRAIALIADRSWVVAHPVHDVCSPLGDGHFHICFPAPAAAAPLFRIEATDNFRQWETVHEAASVEEALHFVDPDTPDLQRRFYRMAPDTASGP